MSKSKGITRKMDYGALYELYGVDKKRLPENTDRAIRKALVYQLDKYLVNIGKSGTPWEYLDEDTKNYFIARIAYKELSKYSKYSEAQIDRRIKDYAIDSLYKAEEDIQRRNNIVDRVWKKHCKTNDSSTQKMIAYEEFCRDMRNFNARVPIPDYDTYAKNPLRPYDYIMDFFNSDIDMVPTIVLVLVMIIEKELKIKIDLYKIFECLSVLRDMPDGYNDFEFESFPTEYDDNWEITKEEFEEVCKKIGKWNEHYKMINDLKGFFKKM